MAKTAQAAKSAAGKRLKVTLLRSTDRVQQDPGGDGHGDGACAGCNHSVELLDTPETRGMIHKVRHLVAVSE